MPLPRYHIRIQTLQNLRLFSPLTRRTFSNGPRLLLKEDKAHDPDHIESVKQSQLKKQERGAGHWHEELASSGESNVKADKEEVGNHEEHIEDLQKHTKGKAEKGEI